MVNTRGAPISKIVPGSIAEEAGISEGDYILSINGKSIEDIFDYKFDITNDRLNMSIQKKDGEIWDIDIEKDTYEDIGIEFADPLFDGIKRCVNKCIFCFIDQLPEGMRDSLYFKDDDIRLSFLMGNYVTLSNVGEKELQRIIQYKMSPINISVHATNPELRAFILGNKSAGNILDKIKILKDAGININCQIVLCKGINDGKELDRTIKDLSSMHPEVNSISVVPVGITRYRDKLFDIKPYNKEEAHDILLQIKEWQNVLLKKTGSRIVYAADEFYILAEQDLPKYEEYEDFYQLENGVGLVSLFEHEFLDNLHKDKKRKYKKLGKDGFSQTLDNNTNQKFAQRIVSIATGVSAGKFIKRLSSELENMYNNLKINVYPIKNNFFGEHVTVAGLLTGEDIVNELSGKELGVELLIPKTMLKSGTQLFLDGYTVKQVEKDLGVKIKIVKVSGKAFLDAVLGEMA